MRSFPVRCGSTIATAVRTSACTRLGWRDLIWIVLLGVIFLLVVIVLVLVLFIFLILFVLFVVLLVVIEFALLRRMLLG